MRMGLHILANLLLLKIVPIKIFSTLNPIFTSFQCFVESFKLCIRRSKREDVFGNECAFTNKGI
jgi:hypothetical protein